MSQDDAPNFRDSTTCKSCAHSCYKNRAGAPMYCEKHKFYFNLTPPYTVTCDDHSDEHREEKT